MTLKSALLSAAACLAVANADVSARADVLEDITIDFELLDGDGNLVRDEDFRGRRLLLVFGFTHCPHICPTMAASMSGALALVDKDAAGVFVSVDTERDTPAVTAAYAENFGPAMLGLSGSYEQVAAAANNFKASFAVTKTQNAYTVQHTSTIYVIGPDGELRETFALDASPATLAAALEAIDD